MTAEMLVVLVAALVAIAVGQQGHPAVPPYPVTYQMNKSE